MTITHFLSRLFFLLLRLRSFRFEGCVSDAQRGDGNTLAVPLLSYETLKIPTRHSGGLKYASGELKMNVDQPKV
jgi:hypothetical protein